MLTLTLVVGSLLAVPQNVSKIAPVTPACTTLTAPEVASLIGQARPMTVTNAPGGSTCMFQNGDKLITVLLVNLDTVDSAKRQWQAKKTVSAGRDVAGWPLPAYSSTVERPKEHVAVFGVVKDKKFLEVKVMDVTQKTSDLGTKLLAVMRTVSARY